MKIQRYLYLVLIFLVLLSLSAVSATDDSASDIISTNQEQELILDESINEDASANDELILEENSAENKILTEKTNIDSDEAEPNLLDTSTGSYSDLRSEIGSGGDITLTKKEYRYTDGDGGTIEINNAGVINGNGAVIDMAGSNIRAFYVYASGVTITNMTIKNANYDGDGGAFYLHGGAIYFDQNGTVTNCNFTNNKATGENSYGGAIYFHESGTVTNCNFTNNKATGKCIYGGAIYFYESGTVTNCNFTNNKATGENSDGGAIYFNEYGTVTNCNFTNNTAEYQGGAILFDNKGTVTECNFDSNSANSGGAIFSQRWATNADTCILKTSSDTNDNRNTVFLPPTLTVDDFTTSYGSGEKIAFDLKTNIDSIPVYDGNISISVYFKNNDSLVGDYSCLSGEEWAVDLPVGSYYAIYNTEYGGFEPINKTITITAPAIQYYINITSVTSNNKTVNITAKSNIPKEIFWDGKLLFILPNSAEISANYGADGTWWAVYTFDDYAEYEVSASYPELDDVTINNGTITLNRVDSTLTVEDITFDYDSTGSATVSFTGATGVNASVVDQPNANVNVEGNTITVSGLNAGTYTLTVTTIADADHNNVTKTSTIIVNKIDSTLTVEDITFDYNSTGSGSISFTGATGVTASVVDQPNANVNVDGNTITVSGLDAGNYTLTVTTIADDNHNNITKTAKITVNKLKTELTATAVTTTYNVNKNLVITLKDSNGKALSGEKVTVDLNGAKTYTTDKNGQVKIAVGSLVPKTYTAKISFAENDKYKASSATAKVTVNKATPKMTAKAKTYKFEDKTKKYTITLKDNKGKVMKNTKVTLKVNGKTYTAKTNSKGVATFKLTKLTKKGKYNAVITYAGNKYYNKLSKKAKITVKAPAWKTVAKGSKDKATVKKIQRALKNNGYYLTYKGHYLKIDGIYKGCTERSVKQFQKAKGLKVTGKVDYNTAKKLKIVS